MARPRTNYVGHVFGRLTARYPLEKNGVTAWECSCECGSTVVVRTNSLTRGFTKSCGCLKQETCTKNLGGRLLVASAWDLGAPRSDWPEDRPGTVYLGWSGGEEETEEEEV